MTNYTNLPAAQQSNTLGQKAFVNYFTSELEINPAVLDALKSFFTSRGFAEDSALSLASTLIAQAKKDNVNAMSFIDILKGYSNLELNSLIAEIVNNNRFKTSYLGFGNIFFPNPEIARNVLP